MFLILQIHSKSNLSHSLIMLCGELALYTTPYTLKQSSRCYIEWYGVRIFAALLFMACSEYNRHRARVHSSLYSSTHCEISWIRDDMPRTHTHTHKPALPPIAWAQRRLQNIHHQCDVHPFFGTRRFWPSAAKVCAAHDVSRLCRMVCWWWWWCGHT